jgi:heptosyltransferase-2
MNSALLSPQRLITVLAARLRRLLSGGKRPGPMPLSRGHLHFLVIRLDQVGDVMLTTPLFRELRHSFPDSRCTVIVRGASAPLVETSPYVDVVLTMPVVTARWLPEFGRKLAAACILYQQQLKRKHYDVAILPRWDVELDLATFVMILANAGATVGYSEHCSPMKSRWNAGFSRAFSVCVEPGPIQHETLRSLDLLRAIGGSVQYPQPELHLVETDKRWANEVLSVASQDELLIVVGFATNNGPSREWPLENYAEVIRILKQKYSIRPVLLSLPSEEQRAERLARDLIVKPILAVGSGLRNFAALLANCDLFIGNDSGLVHLAAIANLPIVMISPHPANGDTNHLNSPLRFGPFAKRLRILQPKHGLDECITHCSRQREAHCVRAITPEQVAAAAIDFLSSCSPTPARYICTARLIQAVASPITSLA